MQQQEELELIRRIVNGETDLYATLPGGTGGWSTRWFPASSAAQRMPRSWLRTFSSRRSATCTGSTGAVRSRPGSSGIAYNTAVSETRRRKREWACIDQARLANLPDSEAERMDAWEGRQEYLDALARAVGELEPEERALVTLFYYEEYSVSECAGITQMSESNVKVRLHRIRKKLYILVNTLLHGNET